MKVATILFLATMVPVAWADEIPKGEKVDFKVFTRPYFEKNTSGHKGDASHLVIVDQTKFDGTFGVGFVMGKKFDLVPKDLFGKNMIVSVIKRGTAIYNYTVESVTMTDSTLYVKYSADGKEGGGTATFASPVLIAVPKDKCKSVVFIENGKKVATVEVQQLKK